MEGLKRGGTKQNVNYSTKTEKIGCKWNMNGYKYMNRFIKTGSSGNGGLK